MILAIVAFSVLSSTTTTGNNQSFTPDNQGLLPVGSKAPDFSANTIDGGSISLGDSEGKNKATMLVFFASWCPHCNKEAPTISELSNSYKDDLRVVMVGIDNQDNQQKVKEFVNNYGIEGPASYDPSLGSTYKVSSYPTIYVLDKDKKITAANSGEVPKDVLEGWIKEASGSGGG